VNQTPKIFVTTSEKYLFPLSIKKFSEVPQKKKSPSHEEDEED